MKYPTMRFVFDRKKVATKTHKGLVQIEVLSEGKRKWIGTGVKVYSDQWNDRKKIINSVEMIQLNQCLDEQLRIIQNWINELISKKEVFDFDKLDRFLRYTNKSESFVDFVERRIEERGDITESTKASHRTFATMCLNNGVKMENVSKMLGHTNVRTTQQYAKVLNAEVEKDFEMLERILS